MVAKISLNKRSFVTAALCSALMGCLTAAAQDMPERDSPAVSILDLMEKTITPASNTLWGAYDAPADETAWQQLEEAAVTMIVATEVNALGGTGPSDDEWASSPAWQAFNSVMLTASQDALDAIRTRNHDALLAAGDVLYPPCEGCHLQFNPGVAGD